MRIGLRDVKAFKLIMAKKGYSMRSLGKKVKLSSGFIAMICGGQRGMSAFSAKKIAEVLDVPFDDLFFVEDVNFYPQEEEVVITYAK